MNFLQRGLNSQCFMSGEDLVDWESGRKRCIARVRNSMCEDLVLSRNPSPDLSSELDLPGRGTGVPPGKCSGPRLGFQFQGNKENLALIIFYYLQQDHCKRRRKKVNVTPLAPILRKCAEASRPSTARSARDRGKPGVLRSGV